MSVRFAAFSPFELLSRYKTGRQCLTLFLRLIYSVQVYKCTYIQRRIADQVPFYTSVSDSLRPYLPMLTSAPIASNVIAMVGGGTAPADVHAVPPPDE